MAKWTLKRDIKEFLNETFQSKKGINVSAAFWNECLDFYWPKPKTKWKFKPIE